jgi:hypothetical protein
LLKEVKRIYNAGTTAIQPVLLQIKSGKHYAMKTMRFLLLTGSIIITTIPCTMVQSQDKDHGCKADPDVKWEVRKEYDENGNLIYYDSSCVPQLEAF